MKLDRRQFLEGAAALGAAPLLGPFEPALAASLPVSTTLNKVPVLIPIHGTSEAFEAPPWLIRMICGFTLAGGESRPRGMSCDLYGPYRAGLHEWYPAEIDHDTYHALKVKERVLAQSLDEVGLYQEVLMNPFRLQLSYRPRGQRLPDVMPYLRCPGDRPLTPEERADLQPLEQELAKLAADGPPRYSPLR